MSHKAHGTMSLLEEKKLSPKQTLSSRLPSFLNKQINNKLILFLFMSIYVHGTCMQVPMETRRGDWIPQELELWAVVSP